MTKDELIERMKYVRVSERRSTLFLISAILVFIIIAVLSTLGWIWIIRIFGIAEML